MVAMRTYVYGILDEGIVVLERTEAEYLERIWRASRQAATWGEFRNLLEERAEAELRERFQMFGADGSVIDDASPADDEPFDSIQADAPGWGEGGGWPAWPSAMMLYDLPAKVRERVGHPTTSILSGDSYAIEPDEEEEIIAAFHELGLTLSRDDALVEKASGY